MSIQTEDAGMAPEAGFPVVRVVEADHGEADVFQAVLLLLVAPLLVGQVVGGPSTKTAAWWSR